MNTDGKSEHQVLPTIEEMGITVAAYKVNGY